MADAPAPHAAAGTVTRIDTRTDTDTGMQVADATVAEAGDGATLVEVTVADEAEAWVAAGFTVVDGAVHLGPTTVRLVGRDGGAKRIVGWTLAGLARPAGTADDQPIDGLPTTTVASSPESAESQAAPADAGPPPADGAHANGAQGIDHVVVLSPDLERTTAAFAPLGLGVRRIRETDTYGAPMRQAFLRVGPTLIEIIGSHEGSGRPADEDPSRWFGLALDVDDLDATAALLGDALGRVKPAVQTGRRIATLRHKEVGMSVPVAFMDRRGMDRRGTDRQA
jgi:catechol 2,3-dioxygenase-like lactoylglutathione lyase family enzyme